MGREIRRVPPNWIHPKNDYCRHRPTCDPVCYKPLYGRYYQEVAREWLDGCIAWNNGTHEELISTPRLQKEYPYYWEWHGRSPDPDDYVPYKKNQATWFQVYETVSEGTPVTPPFKTKKEIIEYLIKNGDFWDQRRGNGGYTREAAEAFVNYEWAPSLVMQVNKDTVKIFNGIQSCSE